MSLITRAEVVEASAFTLYARIETTAGALAQQASVSSIAYAVYDLEDTSSATDSGALTVSEVIKNTGSTETVSGVEYNFVWRPDPDDVIPEPGIYRVEVTVTPTSGNDLSYLWELTAVDRFGD